MNLRQIACLSLFLLSKMAANGQKTTHHAQVEANIPIALQAGYELKINPMGVAVHAGVMPKQALNAVLDLKSNQDPTTQQRNDFLKTVFKNGYVLGLSAKYYFKSSPNSFYAGILGQLPVLNFSTTTTDFLKVFGITNNTPLLKSSLDFTVKMPTLGAIVGKGFNLSDKWLIRTELGVSHIFKNKPSLFSDTNGVLKERITSTLNETFETRQRKGILPTLKIGVDYTF